MLLYENDTYEGYLVLKKNDKEINRFNITALQLPKITREQDGIFDKIYYNGGNYYSKDEKIINWVNSNLDLPITATPNQARHILGYDEMVIVIPKYDEFSGIRAVLKHPNINAINMQEDYLGKPIIFFSIMCEYIITEFRELNTPKHEETHTNLMLLI